MNFIIYIESKNKNEVLHQLFIYIFFQFYTLD